MKSTQRLAESFMDKTKILPFEYDFTDSEIESIGNRLTTILKSKSFLTMGKMGEEFEQHFSEYHNNLNCIATSSGTSALEIIYSYFQLKGKEVLVCTNTFGATITPLVRQGAIPIFVDCDEQLQINYNDLQNKITKKTSAVVVVHIGGFITPNIVKIRNLCQQHNIHLIEDSAHAIGARFSGQLAGTFGDASSFSFFTTKVMTAGEGGAIVTPINELKDFAHKIRNQGQVSENNIDELGYNWRLHEFNAVLLKFQMNKLEAMIQARTKVAQTYDEILGKNNLDRRLFFSPDVQPNYYKYTLLLPNSEWVEKVRSHLLETYGIPLAGYIYQIPCHQQTAFRKFAKHCPNAEKLCRQHICLPISSTIDHETAQYIGLSVRETLTKFGI